MRYKRRLSVDVPDPYSSSLLFFGLIHSSNLYVVVVVVVVVVIDFVLGAQASRS